MSKTLLGPEVGYTDLLNEATAQALKQEAAEGKGFNKTPLRPSAAGQCTRELYYALMEFHGKAKYAKEVKKPEVSRLLSLGHSIEWHILKQFDEHLSMFELKYKQQVLDFGPLVSSDPKMSQRLEGSLDACLFSDKWKCVMDVKSKKDKYSSYRSSQWDETSEKLSKMRSVQALSETAFWVDDLESFLKELRDPFFEANFLQLNLYANSQFLKERGVDHGAILQYGKNDSRIREVRFRPSESIAKKTIQKFQTALDAATVGTPPPRDHNLGSMKCAFCPYARECWDEDSLKAWFKTFPSKQWPDDTSKLGIVGEQLEFMFEERAQKETAASEVKAADEAILKVMVDNELTKVRLSSGEVFEARHYKSPRPHFELKRSKA